MFEVTFLGHQGWSVATPRARILIDPLLTEAFGHRGQLGRVYPPRRIDAAAFPAVDAVVVTHEHDDHFDLPSLARIDRRIAVYLSARSSVAAEDALVELGFSVRRLAADARVEIGDLSLRTFCPDHREDTGGDEWDVVPLQVSDREGHGSLLSSVDVRPSRWMLEALAAEAGVVGIWGYANNFSSTRFCDALGRPAAAADDLEPLVDAVVRRHDEVAAAWGTPRATVVTGGGWSFPGTRAWLDGQVFAVDGPRLAEAMSARLGAPVFAARPGDRWVQQAGASVVRQTRASYLSAAPVETWPDRTYVGGRRLERYAPACGRTRLPVGELDALVDDLQELAQHLYGTAVFRGLCSVSAAATGAQHPAVGLLLLDDAGPTLLRYEPTRCAFVVDATADPIGTLVSGLELWATDLRALLDGEIGPSALCYAGRMRAWNHRPARVRISPFDLWRFAHPLRRPRAARRLYGRIIDGLSDVAPFVRPR